MQTSQSQPWMLTKIRHWGFQFFHWFKRHMTLFCVCVCGMADHVFVGKMAANFLPGRNVLFEIFNDGGSKDRMEGFDHEDQDENNVGPQCDRLSVENRIAGDREPTALPITAKPGLTAEATL